MKINVDIIKSYIYLNQLTKKEFCKHCKISIFVLNKILNSKANFRIKALFKIARKLNIHVCKLFA